MRTLEQMYEDVPIGKENAISRYELCKLWGDISERTVRSFIASLREMDNGDDYVIVSLSHCRGYYRTSDPEEIKAYRKETMNRAKNTFIPLKKVNRILSAHENAGQLELPPNNLKTARKAAGIQAQEAVEIIKKEIDPRFNTVTMSLIENNKALPTAGQLMVMSRLYGKSTGELTGMEIM